LGVEHVRRKGAFTHILIIFQSVCYTKSMDTLIHADIFFFVTTIVVIVLGIFLAVILFYVIRILHSVDILSKQVQEEGSEIVKDVREFREKVKEQGSRWSNIASIFGIIKNAASAAATHRAKKRSRPAKKVEVDVTVERDNEEGN